MSGIRERAGRAVQLYPVTAGALVALTVAALAIVLILDEQSKGRARDDRAAEARVKLRQTDQKLGDAIEQIQDSRREAVLIGCRTNQGQNDVLLALINFSVDRSRARGRIIDPAELSKLDALLRPITPAATQRVCDRLLAKVRRQPPPLP